MPTASAQGGKASDKYPSMYLKVSRVSRRSRHHHLNTTTATKLKGIGNKTEPHVCVCLILRQSRPALFSRIAPTSYTTPLCFPPPNYLS